MISDTPSADAPGIGLPSTYRVFVRDLVIACSIGVYEHERGRKQRVRISAEIWVDRDPALPPDSKKAILNYERVVDGIKAIPDSGHIELVETVGERILDLCFADRRVTGARVAVEKLDVVPEAAGVGIIVERRREQG